MNVESGAKVHMSMMDKQLVNEYIAEVAGAFPRAIAIQHGRNQMSYAELDHLANCLAGHLNSLGIGPGGVVAICMERSPKWIAAALGSMRAGAAYLPLDLAWPDARLRFALEDSGAAAFVASAELLDRLGANAAGIDPSRDAAVLAAAPGFDPKPVDPKSLAYLIYTSGSTGVPKGVEVSHANLAHLIAWHLAAFEVTREDRASHLAGLGFDAAVWEIWPTLCAGATLCLAGDDVRASPELIQQWMIQERVTVGFVPTVHAAPMIGFEWPASTALRVLLTGGDALHKNPPAGLPFKVANNYGPTEGTVVATSTQLEPGASGVPPIGRAIAGASVYLLDEYGKPVVDGAIGEIYVGGDGVASGYRNLPELTERSFLPDPFADSPGARMYRTGDRGSRRPDGEIEFHGRLDRQTKIRGQRIELDEIGSVLSQHEAIDFAVATACASESGENQLVAYVLPATNQSDLTASTLQDHLSSHLPQYMVPAIFVRLNAVPVSANGKVDLSLLPKPSDAPRLNNAEPKPAASATEEKLLGIVREILRNDKVVATDNFFLAGGHSLMGMQLILRVRDAFGEDIALQQLFEAPTVARLALAIKARRSQKKLVAIWKETLKTDLAEQEGADFFELGGNARLTYVLRNRIQAEFGRQLTFTDLVQNRTISKQAQLIHGIVENDPDLPKGVFRLRSGAGNGIVWLYHVEAAANIARMIDSRLSFTYVGFTAEDAASLGNASTFQNIAACLVSKILATQPVGPYTVGGSCIGGVFAYEVACQLRAAGHEVSLVVLMDTPTLPYYKSPYSINAGLSEPLYIAKRIYKEGLRASWRKASERILDRCSFFNSTRRRVHEFREPARRIVMRAVAKYRPQPYEVHETETANVLLLLASVRPPHVDFVPLWQSLIPRGLDVRYIEAHRQELTDVPAVVSIADQITASLGRALNESSFACDALGETSQATVPSCADWKKPVQSQQQADLQRRESK